MLREYPRQYLISFLPLFLQSFKSSLHSFTVRISVNPINLRQFLKSSNLKLIPQQCPSFRHPSSPSDAPATTATPTIRAVEATTRGPSRIPQGPSAGLSGHSILHQSGSRLSLHDAIHCWTHGRMTSFSTRQWSIFPLRAIPVFDIYLALTEEELSLLNCWLPCALTWRIDRVQIQTMTSRLWSGTCHALLFSSGWVCLLVFATESCGVRFLYF